MKDDILECQSIKSDKSVSTKIMAKAKARSLETVGTAICYSIFQTRGKKKKEMIRDEVRELRGGQEVRVFQKLIIHEHLPNHTFLFF